MSDQQVCRAHVWVTGRVQGVFFRQETARAAGAQGVRGWVRNMPDGRVEAVFEGRPAAVQAMVGWVGEGSPWAAVENVEVGWEDPQGEDRFRIRP